jgi:hypothetical protein
MVFAQLEVASDGSLFVLTDVLGEDVVDPTTARPACTACRPGNATSAARLATGHGGCIVTASCRPSARRASLPRS